MRFTVHPADMDTIRSLIEGASSVPIRFNLENAGSKTYTLTLFRPKSVKVAEGRRILQGSIGGSANGKRLAATISYYFEKNIAYLNVEGI